MTASVSVEWPGKTGVKYPNESTQVHSRARRKWCVVGGAALLVDRFEELVAHGDIVSILDIGCHDVPFYPGDITEQNVLYSQGGDITAGIQKLVRARRKTRSLDEGAPYPEKLFDACNDSKAKGEALILATNGKGGLLTVSLRPAGIFGYSWTTPNRHIFELDPITYIYVGRIAEAHLAADKLVNPITSDSTLTASASTDATLVDSESLLCASLHRVLPPIPAMTGCRRGPTPKARLLGPYVTLPQTSPSKAPLIPPKLTHAIVRNRFDQVPENALDVAPPNPLQGAASGQAFFIAKQSDG